MTKDPLIEMFLQSLNNSKKSEVTIYAYAKLLYRLIGDLMVSSQDLNSKIVNEWINENYVNKKKRTIIWVMSVISKFSKYGENKCYFTHPLIKRKQIPRTPDSLPKHLSKEDQVKLRAVSENIDIKKRCIFELFLSSGIRKCELVRLKISDVDLENRTIRILGKGNKIRVVDLTPKCAALIELMIENCISLDEPLFKNRYGDGISGRWAYEIIKNLGLKANLTKPLGPHMLRHSFASNMVSKDASIYFVAKELGHVDPNNTRIYARIPSQIAIQNYRKIMG